MELKQVTMRVRDIDFVSFNRTFMELKHCMDGRQRADEVALIGPLWN